MAVEVMSHSWEERANYMRDERDGLLADNDDLVVVVRTLLASSRKMRAEPTPNELSAFYEAQRDARATLARITGREH
jgi:hypothetical protein